VHTGLRRGEALALKWHDVDRRERLVRVRGTLARIDGQLRVLEPKSAKSRRTIPLSDPAAAVLARLRERTEVERPRLPSCGSTAVTSSSPTSASRATPGTHSAH
jgi:integrase